MCLPIPPRIDKPTLRRGIQALYIGAEWPTCQICARKPAEYDASVPASFGQWGYLCGNCFAKCGARLGVGHGQQLLPSIALLVEQIMINPDNETMVKWATNYLVSDAYGFDTLEVERMLQRPISSSQDIAPLVEDLKSRVFLSDAVQECDVEADDDPIAACDAYAAGEPEMDDAEEFFARYLGSNPVDQYNAYGASQF